MTEGERVREIMSFVQGHDYGGWPQNLYNLRKGGQEEMRETRREKKVGTKNQRYQWHS